MADTAKSSRPDHRWPSHGWIGLALVATSWALNWGLDGLRTHLGFFPLWLGYALTVDALTYRRKGSSLLTRSPARYLGLFLLSAPFWWLFEWLNSRGQNWIYDGRQFFSHLEYFLLASFSFSTVLPAVLSSAELIGTSRRLQTLPAGPRLAPNPMLLRASFLLGLLMLAAFWLLPAIFFPLIWLWLVFVLEALNHWIGAQTLTQHTADRDWRLILALCAAGLLCGFFWEFWNFFSYPKWIYQIPYLDRPQVFEMPLAGYGGYLPFALELYALYSLAFRIVTGRSDHDVQIIAPRPD